MTIQYDTLPGRSRENAKKALDLAVERGFAAEDVRTTRAGYLIPVEDNGNANDLGLSASEATVNAWDGESGSDEPDIDGMKVSELDQFIEDNSLDVDVSLNKPEKQAAIKAALENKE
jgi:hypothetical protein